MEKDWIVADARRFRHRYLSVDIRLVGVRTIEVLARASIGLRDRFVEAMVSKEPSCQPATARSGTQRSNYSCEPRSPINLDDHRRNATDYRSMQHVKIDSASPLEQVGLLHALAPRSQHLARQRALGMMDASLREISIASAAIFRASAYMLDPR
jgi:hypothetical protein